MEWSHHKWKVSPNSKREIHDPRRSSSQQHRYQESETMEKEDRRRKIISRGNDRLALITGRIQTLDPDPLPKSTSFSIPRLDPPLVQHARSSSEPLSPRDRTFSPDYQRTGGDYGADTVRRHDNDGQVSQTNDSGSRDFESGVIERKQASLLSTDNTNLEKHPIHLFGSVTPQQINFSIISSEDTRAICSVVLAILVVLSHVNLPHNVVKPKSLITYKPLYVVLLTDVLIVASRLIPYTQTRIEDQPPPQIVDDGEWGGAIKLLELGLVLHQTTRAIFIDCSLYLVVVICGLSLMV